MSELKSLFDVLPVEKRHVTLMKVADLLRKPVIINSVTFRVAGDTTYATITLTLEGSPAGHTAIFNQPQIVDVLKYLDGGKLFPVRAAFVTVGKSYAITDPAEVTDEPAPKTEGKAANA